jgi:hypothetical protein
VDLGCVGELLLDGGSGGGLEKLTKAGARVGEAPGRNFDEELIEGGKDFFVRGGGHGGESSRLDRVACGQAVFPIETIIRIEIFA